MSPDTRGGQRTGAGRKRLAPDGLVSHNITLAAEDWAVVENLGNGNRSAGVRAMIEYFRKEEWRKSGFTPSSPHTPA
jgi:hypothetical protein